MPKKKKRKRRPEKLIELAKGVPRKEEEKRYVQFSETQMNAVLLIILASTFFVQGVIQYLQFLKKPEFIRPWFIILIVSLALLVFSVVVVTLGQVLSPLKIKREMSLIAFFTFLAGFAVFLAALIFLIFIIAL